MDARLPPLTIQVTPSPRDGEWSDEFEARGRLCFTTTDRELGLALNQLTLRFRNNVPLGLVVTAYADAVWRTIAKLARRRNLAVPPPRPTIPAENEAKHTTPLLDPDHYEELLATGTVSSLWSPVDDYPD